MNLQTQILFSVTPPKTPCFIHPLLASYVPNPWLVGMPINPAALAFNLFPEPYYGDYNKCGVILLTHNPGGSTIQNTGIGSPFHSVIHNINGNPATNYQQMAVLPNFTCQRTNNWIHAINTEVQNHFIGIQNFTGKLFVRDLIPYHSTRFGSLNMSTCASYLYKYFFKQVIEASFRSELYKRINLKNINPSTIIYARGATWKHNKKGLSAIGWELIGKIYCNCYVYKANFEKISRIKDFDRDDYPSSTINHNIYIVVITQALRGAAFGIYINRHAPLVPISLNTLISNYDNNFHLDEVDHNDEMNTFINTIR